MLRRPPWAKPAACSARSPRPPWGKSPRLARGQICVYVGLAGIGRPSRPRMVPPFFLPPLAPFLFPPFQAEAVVRSLRSLRNGGRTKGGTKAGVCALAPIKKKPLSRSPAPPCQGPFFVGARLPRTNRSPQLKPGPSGLRNVAHPPGVLGAAATRAAALEACLQPGRAAPRPRTPGRHPPAYQAPTKKGPWHKNLCVPQLKGAAALRGRYFAGRFALAPWWRPGWPFGVRAARAPARLFSSAVLPRGAWRLAASMARQGATRGKGKKPRYCPPARPRFPAKLGPSRRFFP